MEDTFFLWEMQPDEFEVPVLNQSDFTEYRRPTQEFHPNNHSISLSNPSNMNKRMIEFLRVISTGRSENRESKNDRCYRHMINERARRDKQRQNFEALRSMLPTKIKNEKISIVQAATSYLQDLEKLKVGLQKRNSELEERLTAKECQSLDTTKKIRLRVCCPSSAINSMLGVLRCLKSMDMETRTIQSQFSALEFSAILEIETQMEAETVEKAIQSSLMEAERNLAIGFLEGEEGNYSSEQWYYTS
ncbi:PREDICTED: transcription factor bHLH92-like [Nelumbo nucifera]|uniref:BHLH domain-containing protein n=2 Tax=Nelumbo nucifera TaxID=4432 RepID=A0A822XHP0_NELNU|nr:PREDICTED: transcription factor bHLH92-like [Nelumbo nucifera]DAD19757.1 TPA_asm: hypothetical protein HUJ06_021220 [Nelumbo nucifera]